MGGACRRSVADACSPFSLECASRRSGSSSAGATKGIKRRFRAKSALDYLIREKPIMFADEAERRPDFAKDLPRFLAGIWQVFNQYELAGYVASQKPAARIQLRRLLYMK
jgi:hypothetical protein